MEEMVERSHKKGEETWGQDTSRALGPNPSSVSYYLYDLKEDLNLAQPQFLIYKMGYNKDEMQNPRSDLDKTRMNAVFC